MPIVERDTTASAATLWEVMSRLPEWDHLLPTIDAITTVGPPGPVGEGSTFRVEQPGLPAADYVVTEWRPGTGFTWQSQAPGIRAVARHHLVSEGSRTTLRLEIEWTGPLAWPFRLLLTRKARRYMTSEADTFVSLAERS